MVRIFSTWRVGLTKHTVMRVDERGRSRAGEMAPWQKAVVSTGAMMNARGEAEGEAVRLW
jgi:hypothetical protein